MSSGERHGQRSGGVFEQYDAQMKTAMHER
jgi:hypothetical protein